ncbi:MAG: hypothetical protein LCH39_05540 [Proteobacteria bacterium]|nr:hypothetical protein [Pseudomonadota bacterium]
MEDYDPLIDALPKSIRPVAEHLGMGIVRRMVEAVPGTRLHIPKKFSETPQQSRYANAPIRMLSEEDQKALIQDFGGEDMVVPVSLKTTKWRHQKIKQMVAAGKTTGEIGLEVGLHRRSVLLAIKGMGLAHHGKPDASPSISDGHLTPHDGSLSTHPTRNHKKPARTPENAI